MSERPLGFIPEPMIVPIDKLLPTRKSPEGMRPAIPC